MPPRPSNYLCWSLLSVVCAVRAQSTDLDRFLSLSLSELLDLKISTVTKAPRPITEAPAIVSVIRRAEIEFWGYRSLAEALVGVPGLYAIHDGLLPDIGVRGINGGQRGYSKLFKLMIDGQPVGFRADTVNFLGPELLAMSAIERIEVVRGPVSALYGANAFLGVINVITRREPGSQVTVAGTNGSGANNAGGGIDLRWAHSAEPWQAQLTLQAQSQPYDGQPLPDSSPNRARYDDPQTRATLRRPRSALLNIGHNGTHISQSLSAHYSRLDSTAEFLDFGTLSHTNRIALNSQEWWWQGQAPLANAWSLNWRLAQARGEPGTNERLSTGAAATYPERRFSYDSLESALEAQRHWPNGISFTAGADWNRETHDTQEIYQVERATGVKTLVSAPGHELRFRNTGAYLQLSWPFLSHWELTVNGRADQHSAYGRNDSYRLGLIQHWSEAVHLKLLYGTSYKAPAASQLDTQPLYPGDVIGNPELSPEQAEVWELALSWRLNEYWHTSVNVYRNRVEDKVELLPFASNVRPENVGHQDGDGFEWELRWQAAQHNVDLALAWQDTDSTVSYPLRSEIVTATERFPKLTTILRWQYADARWGRPGLRWRYASERRSSNSNTLYNNQHAYQLPAYALLDAVYSKDFGAHRLQARVDNLLDKTYAEPGFAGIDLPGQERTYVLSYHYAF